MSVKGGVHHSSLGWGASLFARVGCITLRSGGVHHSSLGWGASLFARVGCITLRSRKQEESYSEEEDVPEDYF